MGFFKIEEYAKKYNIPLGKESLLIAINGVRNCGKTYSILNWIFVNNIVNKESKLGIIRNTMEQLKNFIGEFNSMFAGRYVISGNKIYTVISKEEVTKDKEKVIVERKGDLCGYVGSLSTKSSMKGILSENVKFIFYDEFNEESQQKQYKAFCDILKTLERFNSLKYTFTIIMAANRIDPNNEYLVKWGILPRMEYSEDEVIHFSKRGWFIDLGDNNFKDLGNENTLANEFATFDETTNRYLNSGGWLNSPSLKVLPFAKKIEPTFYSVCGFVFDDYNLTFVCFKYNNCEVYAICDNIKAYQDRQKEKLKVISLNYGGYKDSESVITPKEIQKKWWQRLLLLHKKGHLFYDNFDIMEEVSFILDTTDFEEYFK